MFQKVLIANRGEVARRIIRACRQLSIQTVAVFSTADRDALFVKEADEAVQIGPVPVAESYLNREAILMAGVIKDCDAVHPGYGFLSEDALFAEMVEESGMTWIGPQPAMIERFADKNKSRQWAIGRNVPVIPGTSVITSLNELHDEVKKIGFPVLIKSSLGGGGKGIRKAQNQYELEQEFNTVQQEATASFGESPIYLEKELANPQHIEVQVIGNNAGIQILGDRNCSIQIHRQKVVEESPALLPAKQRRELYRLVHLLLDNSGYQNLATVEFLYSQKQFYFLEMNTRLQVEHGVTELTTQVDIVQDQIKIASGEAIEFCLNEVQNHAIEVRINALTPGNLEILCFPTGVRIDTGVQEGDRLLSFYDPLIAKMLVTGETREDAVFNLERALSKVEIRGVATNIDQIQQLLNSKVFQSGSYDIHTFQEIIEEEQK
ncbi:acetyl-CoA carboxylase biotin carboxylase subunit [Pediococcus claussenii]|uniref:biotin carboxylase n=2 Tax=Pediococcus claussenii TaxID=187452 RepID=G8PB46_PEDCP|nr:biotin carboxylase N-terminal domain-containing protein [Pediococcus claussenii]AEV94675.1 acetyl-CoA carboxylase, biotin carboxylase subunit [Pediococcus claussenii ATCC BAA-344]KRN20854.1 accC protein [Pediococcus claussenii]